MEPRGLARFGGAIFAIIAAATLSGPVAFAQDQGVGDAPAETQSPAAAAIQPPVRAACPPSYQGAVCIAPLTPVRLIIRGHLGSKISKSGDLFDLELAEPVLVDGKEAIPAGTRGQGEVVHAKKSGGSGASGELVLAARYLEVGGRRLRLRSMHIATAGEDKIGAVNTLNVASVASPVPGLSLIGFFVKGKGIDLPEGTPAVAKTAEPFLIEISPPRVTVEPAPAQNSTETPHNGGVNEQA